MAVEPKDVLEADRRDIETWLDDRNLSPKSRYRYISILASFYDWAVDEELLEKSPTRRIRRPKTGRALPRPTLDDDLTLALAGADARMRAWLLLGAYQGLRCCEMAVLQVEDLMLTRRPPLLVVSHGKGGRERVLPLNPEVEAALRVYGLPRCGYIFTSDGTRPLVAETVSHTIRLYLHGLGIHATAHQLRHWFASTVYRRTGDLRLTQELMGHAFPSTTAIYAAWDTKAADAVVRSPGLDRAGPRRGRGLSACSKRWRRSTTEFRPYTVVSDLDSADGGRSEGPNAIREHPRSRPPMITDAGTDIADHESTATTSCRTKDLPCRLAGIKSLSGLLPGYRSVQTLYRARGGRNPSYDRRRTQHQGGAGRSS